VRALARELGVSPAILDKPPSADLWSGQSDEDELGFTYEEVDRLLVFLVDRRYHEEEVAALGFPHERVEEVAGRIRRFHFKRHLPVIAKISPRTMDWDFRYARDWGV
jgi:NAD+ synthase